MNPFAAKHSWESVLIQIVEGLENGSVVFPENVSSSGAANAAVVSPEDIRKHLAPFSPFRVITNDNRVYVVQRPEFVMIGESSIVIGQPSERDPFTYSHCDVLSLRDVARLEPGDDTLQRR